MNSEEMKGEKKSAALMLTHLIRKARRAKSAPNPKNSVRHLRGSVQYMPP